MRNFLIEGVSGAGKTSVAEELERRGYHVVHGDRVLAYTGDPETGERLGAAPDDVADKLAWGYARWIWPVERVRALAADTSHAATFFCGGSRNHHKFLDVFDQTFVLTLDAQTLRGRLVGRGDDEFGGKPDEEALVLRLHATGEDMPEGHIRIDSTPDVVEVVDAILARCGLD